VTEGALLQIVRDMLTLVFLIAAPLLGAALVMGLAVSIFQVITSIQDMTLTFIPKMVVICLMTLLLLPWIVDRITNYTLALLGDFARFLG